MLASMTALMSGSGPREKMPKRLKKTKRDSDPRAGGRERADRPSEDPVQTSNKTRGHGYNDPGEFARCLTDLIDRSGAFANRLEWAEFLAVSQPAISQWVKSRTIPEPENLRMIVQRVEEAGGDPTLLEKFNAMALKPAREVSPIGDRFGFSVAEYLLKPRRDALLTRLRRLSVADQEALLSSVASSLDAVEQGRAPIATTPSQVTVEDTARRKAEELYERANLPSWVQEEIAKPLLLRNDCPSRKTILREFCISVFEQLYRNNKQTTYLVLAGALESKVLKQHHEMLALSKAPAALAALFLTTPGVSLQFKPEQPAALSCTPPQKFLAHGTPSKDQQLLKGAVDGIDMNKAILKLADFGSGVNPEIQFSSLPRFNRSAAAGGPGNEPVIRKLRTQGKTLTED